MHAKAMLKEVDVDVDVDVEVDVDVDVDKEVDAHQGLIVLVLEDKVSEL